MQDVCGAFDLADLKQVPKFSTHKPKQYHSLYFLKPVWLGFNYLQPSIQTKLHMVYPYFPGEKNWGKPGELSEYQVARPWSQFYSSWPPSLNHNRIRLQAKVQNHSSLEKSDPLAKRSTHCSCMSSSCRSKKKVWRLITVTTYHSHTPWGPGLLTYTSPQAAHGGSSPLQLVVDVLSISSYLQEWHRIPAGIVGEKDLK